MSTRPRRDRTTWLWIWKPTFAAIAGASVLGLLAIGIAPRAWSGQDQKPAQTRAGNVESKNVQKQRFKSLQELHDAYTLRQEKLEKDRIADLNDLTGRQTGAEAEGTFQELFQLAMARNQYEAAEQAARRYQKLKGGNRQTRSLATLIVIIAHADRGEYDRSLAELESYLKRKGIPDDPAERLDPQTVFALGEAYLNRLTEAGRFDIAERVCEMGANTPTRRFENTSKSAQAVRHGRQTRAPLQGKDVDGRAIKLADFKGKVVVIDFWATWCPPCIARMPVLADLRQKYEKKGFEILGVNLDSVREDLGGDSKKAVPIIRRFVLANRVGWPNVVDDSSVAKAYEINDIPASFLIDRAGIVRGVDLAGPSLDKVVSAEVAKKGK